MFNKSMHAPIQAKYFDSKINPTNDFQGDTLLINKYLDAHKHTHTYTYMCI